MPINQTSGQNSEFLQEMRSIELINTSTSPVSPAISPPTDMPKKIDYDPLKDPNLSNMRQFPLENRTKESLR